MPQAFYILFGAAFTVLVAFALGGFLLCVLGLRLYRAEERLLAFVAGSALLSGVLFALAALHLIQKGVLLALGLAVIVLAAKRGALRPRGDSFPPLPRFWKYLFAAVFAVFFVLYFTNAMAPERSPDGSSYHLGLVARYVRERGFARITTNMYANLSQGIEMLFLHAFVFGRHSAAALVHFSFLVALPLMMLAYAKRFGFPQPGAAGALFFFVSPVVGVDGISAYNDVAVAAILFAIFYLLQIWDRERTPALLVLIGLLAGFAYAAKYTAFVALPYALAFLGWKLYRAKQPVLRPLLKVTLLASLMIAPWMVKNWIVVDNPLSPFFNRLFPNPYVHVSFEEEYARGMRNYPELKSYWEIPLEATVRGRVLGGLLGPLFLLSPFALFALRKRAGRQLLLATAVFGSTYAANIGTRFLIPPAPFVSLAMGLVFVRLPDVAPTLVIAHAVFSWPSHILWYADRQCWRMERWQPKQALRIESEESWLNFKMPSYSIARMIETLVPPGGKVFTLTQVAEAYTSREILVAYQAASNHTMGDILWTPIIRDYSPTWHHTFRFPPERLRKVRVVQTAGGGPHLWSVSEMRVYLGDRELRRERHWRLRAQPNPWDVQLAFDNSPVTRWRSWERLRPGMFLEIDFGTADTVDHVLLECSRDQFNIRMRLEGQLPSGEWKTLDGESEQSFVPAPHGMRRAATEELKARGVNYLLIHDFDFGADDLRIWASAWGIERIGERGAGKLYRIK